MPIRPAAPASKITIPPRSGKPDPRVFPAQIAQLTQKRPPKEATFCKLLPLGYSARTTKNRIFSGTELISQIHVVSAVCPNSLGEFSSSSNVAAPYT
jgi:hypothetical protein